MLNIPIIAIIGARQVGKTTLVRSLLSNFSNTSFLDLKKKSDRQIIENTEEFLNLNKGKVICIDKIQIMPDVIAEIRNLVDNNNDTKFILLSSLSPNLSTKTTKSLAGRIFYFELKNNVSMQSYRLLGGMQRSILAKNNKLTFVWLKNYIRTFLERDLRNFGFNIPPDTLHRLWQILAHINGQILNSSQLANPIELSHTTVKTYIDILANTFMLRILQPYYVNIKKYLIKSPKVYFRDTGVLHTLLNIKSYNNLFVHPVYESSWEVTVIENVIAKYSGWNYYFYRMATGNEIDLVLTKTNKVVAIEIKNTYTPKLTKKFWFQLTSNFLADYQLFIFFNFFIYLFTFFLFVSKNIQRNFFSREIALNDIQADESYVIASVRMPYSLKNNVMEYPLQEFLEREID